ncbi:nucleotide-diphospho-sugar transferase [Leucosporidium creatinivorum]|uniref:Nucleotide-diphospho-sugar transferase n=1 Tax=Leucosporidium creatinivorum TaxID=106004 RepID=A0A1Y2G2P5_9BASI|nr:nucleotide-diphospho-sugar transferase [Leucosporidium creatinivorum]
MVPAPKPSCWATLLTKCEYLQGALVLDQSLRKHNSAYPLVVYATPSLPLEAREILQARRIAVRDVAYLEPVDKLKAKLDDHDHRFADTWTKLRAFELVEYERVVMVDSDMLVTDNMDELMTMPLEEGWIAAGHACTCNPMKLKHYPSNWIPENCGHSLANLTQPILPSQFTKPTHHLLNSGLVVLEPSAAAFGKIYDTLQYDERVLTFQFPDQDLLAAVYKDRFLPLSYRYNALKTLRHCHPNMWRDEDVKNIHYIMKKPWAQRLPIDDPNSFTHQLWWDAYEELKASWGDAPHWDIVAKYVVS